MIPIIAMFIMTYLNIIVILHFLRRKFEDNTSYETIKCLELSVMVLLPMFMVFIYTWLKFRFWE